MVKDRKVNLYPYIHYRFQNYKLYGLNSYKESSITPNNLSYLDKNYNFPNDNVIPDSMVKKLEGGILALFGDDKKDKYKKEREEIQKRIVDGEIKNLNDMFNKMGDVLPGYTTNSLNKQLKDLGATQMSRTNTKKMIDFYNGKNSKGAQNNVLRHLSLLKMTRDKLSKEIKNIEKKKGSIKEASLKSWLSATEDLIHVYENIQKDLGDSIIIRTSNKQSAINTKKFNNLENSAQLSEQIMDAHEQTIHLFKTLLGISSLNDIKGEYLEQAGAEIFLNVSKLGDETAGNCADGIFKPYGTSTKGAIGQAGGLSSGSVKQYKNLRKTFEKEANNNYSKTLWNMDYIEELSEDVNHKSKADISVIFELDGKETPLGISAKNINLYDNSGVHIVDSSPLLYLLQNDFDLTWHTANIFAMHNANDDDHDEGAYRAKILPYLRKLIIYGALTGDTLRGDSNGFKATADYFLINNNKGLGKGSIKLISMGDLYNKIINNTASQIIKVSGEDIENMSFRNDFVGKKLVSAHKSGKIKRGSKQKKLKSITTKKINSILDAQIRVRNILLDMHKKKVEVRIKQSFFRSNYFKKE